MAQQDEPLRSNTTSERILAVRGDQQLERADRLATEEPMEIQVRGAGQEVERVAVTMRTPGNDFELAVGFLFTEGLIHSRDDVDSVRYCETELPEQRYNVVTVRLTRPFDAGTFQRNFYATSSCGVCGKASIDHIQLECAPIPPGPTVARSVIIGLPDALRAAQRVFEQTGGLHASGLFDTDGKLLSLREDVGATTHWTRSWARRCCRARSPSPSRCSRSRGERASRSCRRPRWPASRSCPRCRPRRAWRWRRPSGWA